MGLGWQRSLERTGPLLPCLILLVAFFVVPMLVLLPTSLRPYKAGVGIGNGWTIEHYVKLLTDAWYLRITLRTLTLGFLVTALDLVIGYPLAYFLVRSKSRHRHWLVILVIFPLFLNLVVRSFGWMVILTNHGLINEMLISLGLISEPLKLMFNFTGVVIGLTHIMIPFMVLVLASSIKNISTDLEEAAGVLGATRLQTFFRVTLPLTIPGILSASILVFVLTISALVTPKMLGGGKYQVMSTLIYDEFLFLLNWPSGAAIAFFLTSIVVVLIFLSTILLQRGLIRR